MLEINMHQNINSKIGNNKMLSFNKKQTIRPQIILNDDECAIFGYGSLVNIQSMEKTLKHKYIGPIILTYL